MKKGWMLVIALALVTLVAVTPVMAGNGNQSGSQGQYGQEQNQSQQQNQNQEQNQSRQQHQNQEQNQSQQHQNQGQNQGQSGQHHGAGQQPEPLPGKPVFALTGTVTALGADSITVLVYNGNRYVKPYFGQELVVLVTENTRYWQWTPDGYIPIGFGDVQVGDTASMRGLISDGTFTALRVTIDVPCCTP